MTDSEQLKELQAQGQEAASFIQSAVVQAAINDSGNLGRSFIFPSSLSTKCTIMPNILCVYCIAEMVVQSEHHGTYAEPVVPGMDLPKEKKKKKSD